VRATRRPGTRLLRAGLAGLIVVGFAAIVTTTSARAAEQTVSDNNFRTGWDPNEAGLAPQASDFGERFNVALQGQIYAQPLVIAATATTPATLIIATETDKVYGLNPDTGAVRWTRSLGTPWPSATVDCGNITNQIGVTSTPVYDPDTGAVYVMAKTTGTTPTGAADPLHPNWRLHALSVATGKDLSGWPVTISGVPDNDPDHAFNSETVAQRPGLLLLDGVIYAGFASYCDAGPFDGYVAGISATAHKITTLWTTTAGTDDGFAGIWQSGGGLVSDGQGRIFVATGNGNGDAPPPGPGDAPPQELSQSVVRLAVASDGKLSAKDFFSPSNNASLNADDLDLGSGGPLAIPELVDGKRLLVQVGKDGRVFLLNRDNLGGTAQGPGGTDGVVDVSGPFNGVWGHPAYWGGPGNVAAAGGYVYDVENQGPLRAFHLSTSAAGTSALTPVATSTGTFGYTSGSPVITSAGTDAGSALIWVVYTQTPFGQGGDLRAYDAVPHNGTLDEVYSSVDDSNVTFTDEKFTTPATDGNRIYFGTHDGHVLSFGETSTPAVAADPAGFGGVAVGASSSPQVVTLTASRNATIASVTAQGPFSITPAPNLPTTLTSGATLDVSVDFSPTQVGAAEGNLVVTTQDGRTDYLGLWGRGTSPGLAGTPSALDFGTVPTGSTKTFDVDIANTGSDPQTVASASLDQTDTSDPFTMSGPSPVGQTIQPGDTLAVPVTYSPTTSASAAATGTLHVAGGGGTAASVSLTAASITGNATLTISPNPLKFHSVDLGASVTKEFTVRNTGNIPLRFSKAAPPQGDFETSTPLAEGTTLLPNQAIKQNITYTPTTSGPSSAIYYFNFNDETNATHDPQIEELKGSGVDEIALYYAQLGGASSALGKPSAPEFSIIGGRERLYKSGRIYWSTATGAHALRGAILTHYVALGGVTGFAGFPTSDVYAASDGRGHQASFAGAGGTLFVTRSGVGTHEVNGAIRKRWTALGGVIGRLGYPITDEFGTPKGLRRSNFQHGDITWNPKSGHIKVTFTK
jgi:uncharacterized protein with LGFP repeats